MPTSTLPNDTVLVPAEHITLAEEGRDRKVFCNLRPKQRKYVQAPKSWEITVMDPSVTTFLQGLQPPTCLLVHFQGYSEETGTAIITLAKEIYWRSEDNIPRLDFDHPEVMQQIHGCPNFWGAFILSIAQVPDGTELMCRPDDGRLFTRFARGLAIPQAMKVEQ